MFSQGKENMQARRKWTEIKREKPSNWEFGNLKNYLSK